jgi:hypothetical protein
VEPPKHDRSPGYVSQLHQDDAVQGLLSGCAGLEGECRIARARLEVLQSETRGLGDVPELLESKARGLEGGLRSMPKDTTYRMRENLLSMGAQHCARLEAESCNKARSANTCMRLTGVGACDMGVVQVYAKGCVKHSAAVT